MAERRKLHLARLSLAALGLGILIALAGCGAPAEVTASAASAIGTGGTHTVSRGETIYHIAHEYGVSPDRLIAVNHLTRPENLYVGEVLVIPGRMSEASALGFSDPWSVAPADRQFAWPVLAGVVSSPFGMRNGVMHDGVDIAAPAGTPVCAADDGRVVFSGRLHGYGNVVIVQHVDAYITVYGHNRRNLVSEGERIGKGREIAELGASGRASGPNLHFEVRYHNHPQNPLAYLPAPGPASGISFARNGGS
ncbi:MAG TPA: peptidoglycan DD-metalloendopeptidase family protein [Candidatus Binataceae bacterium]|nr:peptidoglycan DD-metalloendopeptidase family protein [Candidatus Binataceae bacterium]